MRLPLKHFRQREPHTCGWCACRVVYHHHGISSRHVRTGLRVDEPVIPFKDDSTGVLPTALLRLLRSDGFLVDVLPVDRRSLGTICRRLDQGHPTIALQGEDVGSLHWVVIGGHSKNHLHVMDSISTKASGWRRTIKEAAPDQFISFFSITGCDGETRETSMLDMLRSFPKLRHIWRIVCNEFGN